MWHPRYRPPLGVPSIVAGLGLSLFATPALSLTVVDTCGQVVVASGVLTADLDCTGFPDDALTLGPGAKLDLAGFTLTGGNGHAVLCEGSCTVFSSGPQGTIRDAAQNGIANPLTLFPPARIVVRNLLITGNGGRGASAGSDQHAELRVEDSTVTNNGGTGVAAVHRLVVRDSTISFNFRGILGSDSTLVSGSQVDGNLEHGIETAHLNCRDSSFSDNQGHGISGFIQGDVGWTVKLRNCSADGNGLDGFYLERVLLSRLNIRGGSFSGNGGDGIHFNDTFASIFEAAARISDADISGNTGFGISLGAGEPLESLQIRRSTVNGNGASGISGRFDLKGLRVDASTVTGNGLHGVAHFADPDSGTGPCLVRLSKSQVTGNGIDAQCGVSVSCADVASCEPPEISSSSCVTDYDTESGFPGASWGVCGS